MEPLKRIKPVQVLTDDAINDIKRAVIYIECANEHLNDKFGADIVANLKAIIEDVQS